MSSTAPSPKQLAILRHLLTHTCVPMGKHSWRWHPQSPAQPSLVNQRTSSLFRRNLVELSPEGNMTLTPLGRIAANRVS